MLVTCEHCQTPLFELRGSCLVVKAKHHHQWHISVIPIARLLALAVDQGLDSKASLCNNHTNRQTTNR